jgi:uncharacterized membrane protein (UPF0136 family)
MLFAKSSPSSSSAAAPPRGIVINTSVGSLVVAGGIMGFVKAGSKASLIAGSTFGGLLFVSALLIRQSQKQQENENKKKTALSLGNMLGGAVATALFKTMKKKFVSSGKFIPSGLIAAVSAMAAVYNVMELIRLTLAVQTTTTTVEEPEPTTTTIPPALEIDTDDTAQ